MEDNLHFSTSFDNARRLFRSLSEKASFSLTVIPLPGLLSPGGETLSIDIAVSPNYNPATTSSVFLHTSGIHGVEGFLGSAIQCHLISNWKNSTDDTPAMVLVHCVNPWGMAWRRRCNERNVDLNRNFISEGDRSVFRARAVSDLQVATRNLLLHPYPLLSTFGFFLACTRLIFKYGFQNLKNAIAGGQYVYDKSLFFGGFELELGPRRLLQALTRILNGTELRRVVLVDVHTGLGDRYFVLIFQGLGRYAREYLFPLKEDPMNYNLPPTKSLVDLKKVSSFGYTTSGTLSNGVWSVLKAKTNPPTFHALVQEFGTYSTLSVLNALRRENLLHNQCNREGEADAPSLSTPFTQYCKSQLDSKENLLLLHLFNPPHSTWREKACREGLRTVEFVSEWMVLSQSQQP